MLPSEIARLILDYVETMGYAQTASLMLKEFRELFEVREQRKQGHVTNLRVGNFTLKAILDDYTSSECFIYETVKKYPATFCKINSCDMLSKKVEILIAISLSSRIQNKKFVPLHNRSFEWPCECKIKKSSQTITVNIPNQEIQEIPMTIPDRDKGDESLNDDILPEENSSSPGLLGCVVENAESAEAPPASTPPQQRSPQRKDGSARKKSNPPHKSPSSKKEEKMEKLLNSLLTNTALHQKIAENINKTLFNSPAKSFGASAECLAVANSPSQPGVEPSGVQDCFSGSTQIQDGQSLAQDTFSLTSQSSDFAGQTTSHFAFADNVISSLCYQVTNDPVVDSILASLDNSCVERRIEPRNLSTPVPDVSASEKSQQGFNLADNFVASKTQNLEEFPSTISNTFDSESSNMSGPTSKTITSGSGELPAGTCSFQDTSKFSSIAPSACSSQSSLRTSSLTNDPANSLIHAHNANSVSSEKSNRNCSLNSNLTDKSSHVTETVETSNNAAKTTEKSDDVANTADKSGDVANSAIKSISGGVSLSIDGENDPANPPNESYGSDNAENKKNNNDSSRSRDHCHSLFDEEEDTARKLAKIIKNRRRPVRIKPAKPRSNGYKFSRQQKQDPNKDSGISESSDTDKTKENSSSESHSSTEPNSSAVESTEVHPGISQNENDVLTTKHQQENEVSHKLGSNHSLIQETNPPHEVNCLDTAGSDTIRSHESSPQQENTSLNGAIVSECSSQKLPQHEDITTSKISSDDSKTINQEEDAALNKTQSNGNFEELPHQENLNKIVSNVSLQKTPQQEDSNLNKIVRDDISPQLNPQQENKTQIDEQLIHSTENLHYEIIHDPLQQFVHLSPNLASLLSFSESFVLGSDLFAGEESPSRQKITLYRGSHSTPRNKGHIRTLDFKTPPLKYASATKMSKAKANLNFSSPFKKLNLSRAVKDLRLETVAEDSLELVENEMLENPTKCHENPTKCHENPTECHENPAEYHESIRNSQENSTTKKNWSVSRDLFLSDSDEENSSLNKTPKHIRSDKNSKKETCLNEIRLLKSPRISNHSSNGNSNPGLGIFQSSSEKSSLIKSLNNVGGSSHVDVSQGLEKTNKDSYIHSTCSQSNVAPNFQKHPSRGEVIPDLVKLSNDIAPRNTSPIEKHKDGSKMKYMHIEEVLKHDLLNKTQSNRESNKSRKENWSENTSEYKAKSAGASIKLSNDTRYTNKDSQLSSISNDRHQKSFNSKTVLVQTNDLKSPVRDCDKYKSLNNNNGTKFKSSDLKRMENVPKTVIELNNINESLKTQNNNCKLVPDELNNKRSEEEKFKNRTAPPCDLRLGGNVAKIERGQSHQKEIRSCDTNSEKYNKEKPKYNDQVTDESVYERINSKHRKHRSKHSHSNKHSPSDKRQESAKRSTDTSLNSTSSEKGFSLNENHSTKRNSLSLKTATNSYKCSGDSSYDRMNSAENKDISKKISNSQLYQENGHPNSSIVTNIKNKKLQNNDTYSDSQSSVSKSSRRSIFDIDESMDCDTMQKEDVQSSLNGKESDGMKNVRGPHSGSSVRDCENVESTYQSERHHLNSPKEPRTFRSSPQTPKDSCRSKVSSTGGCARTSPYISPKVARRDKVDDEARTPTNDFSRSRKTSQCSSVDIVGDRTPRGDTPSRTPVSALKTKQYSDIERQLALMDGTRRSPVERRATYGVQPLNEENLIRALFTPAHPSQTQPEDFEFTRAGCLENISANRIASECSQSTAETDRSNASNHYSSSRSANSDLCEQDLEEVEVTLEHSKVFDLLSLNLGSSLYDKKRKRSVMPENDVSDNNSSKKVKVNSPHKNNINAKGTQNVLDKRKDAKVSKDPVGGGSISFIGENTFVNTGDESLLPIPPTPGKFLEFASPKSAASNLKESALKSIASKNTIPPSLIVQPVRESKTTRPDPNGKSLLPQSSRHNTTPGTHSVQSTKHNTAPGTDARHSTPSEPVRKSLPDSSRHLSKDRKGVKISKEPIRRSPRKLSSSTAAPQNDLRNHQRYSRKPSPQKPPNRAKSRSDLSPKSLKTHNAGSSSSHSSSRSSKRR